MPLFNFFWAGTDARSGPNQTSNIHLDLNMPEAHSQSKQSKKMKTQALSHTTRLAQLTERAERVLLHAAQVQIARAWCEWTSVLSSPAAPSTAPSDALDALPAGKDDNDGGGAGEGAPGGGASLLAPRTWQTRALRGPRAAQLPALELPAGAGGTHQQSVLHAPP